VLIKSQNEKHFFKVGWSLREIATDWRCAEQQHARLAFTEYEVVNKNWPALPALCQSAFTAS